MSSNLTTSEAAQYLSERLSRTYTSNAVRQIVRRAQKGGKWLTNARNTQPGNPRGVWLIVQEDLDAYIEYKRTRRSRKGTEG